MFLMLYDVSMKEKLKAKLIGGPNDGQTRILGEAYHTLQIAHRVRERNGLWRTISLGTYRLKTTEPLEYEFEM
jgi:hypothetical protein